MPRGLCGVHLGLASALWCAPLGAQQQLDLVWDAPASCPQAGSVREQIRALSGDAPKTAGGLRAEGSIVRVDGRYRLTLTVRDGSIARKRTIESETCADLAGAAAVSLGLLLQKEPQARREAIEAQAAEERDGDAEARSSENPADRASDARRAEQDAQGSRGTKRPAATPGKAGADEERPSDTEKPSDDPETPDDDGASGKRRWHVVLVAPLGTLDVGPLPKPRGGIGAGLGFRYDAWRVAAALRGLSGQTLQAADLPGVSARAEVVSTELATCRGFRANRFELAPCAVVALDWITARGAGSDVASRPGRTRLLALGAGAAAHVHLFDWMAIAASASFGIETSRPRLVIDGLGEVRQFGPVRISLGVGPEWIF